MEAGDYPKKISDKKYIVLKGKEHGNVFWTSGGEYRTDWYELLHETDDIEEAKRYWHLNYYKYILK